MIHLSKLSTQVVKTRAFSSRASDEILSGQVSLKSLEISDDLPKLIDLCTKAFLRNPIHKFRKTQHEHLHKYFSEVVPNFAKDGLSVVAVENKNPVGFLLNIDLFDPYYVRRHTKNTSPRILTEFRSDMVELIDKCNNWYIKNCFPDAKLGDIFLLELMGVEPHLLGKGIPKAMVKTSIEVGRNKKFKRAFFQSVNSISTHIFQKNGFKLLRSVEYDSFVMEDGRTPFAGIKNVFPKENFDMMELVYRN